VTRGAFLVRAELAIGALAALLPVVMFAATPSYLTPMFDDRVSLLGVPSNVILLAISVAAAITGWMWMMRISRGPSEPDRVTWRRSALTDRPRRKVLLVLAALVCVAIAAVAVYGLLSLPHVPWIRLRTIAVVFVECAAVIASIAALGWIALTAWFGGDDR
jgi:hypothetical protein